MLPDLKRLGPRLGKRLPALRKRLSEIEPAELLGALETEKKVTVNLPDGPVVLDADDIQVRLQAKPGWAAAQGRTCVVVLSTELSEQLILEGLVRELVHAIQTQRKERNFRYTDRIAVGIETDDGRLRDAVVEFGDYIQRETLAVRLQLRSLPAEPIELDIGGSLCTLFIRITSPEYAG